jgi:integrase
MYTSPSNQPKNATRKKRTLTSYNLQLKRIIELGTKAFDGLKTKSSITHLGSALRYAQGILSDPDGAKDSVYDICSEALVQIGGADKISQLIDQLRSGPLKRKVGRSKKLIGLPQDWAENMVTASASEKTLEHLAVVALYMTGCRPDEIQNIAMKISLKTNSLLVVIAGAKVKNMAGQEKRGLFFTLQGFAAELAQICDDESIHHPFQNINARRVERLVEKASKKVLGDERRVSASTFRNHVASVMKARHASPTEIAQFLGHQSEVTQTDYGRATYGKNSSNWIAPIKLTVSTPVRQVMSAAQKFAERASDSMSCMQSRPTGG